MGWFSQLFESALRFPALESGQPNFAYTFPDTNHRVFVVPAAWKKRRVVFKARGGAVWIVFGTAASVEADRGARVTGTPPAWTTSATIAYPIDNGESIDRYIRNKWTHFSIEADTLNAEIYAHLSDLGQNE